MRKCDTEKRKADINGRVWRRCKPIVGKFSSIVGALFVVSSCHLPSLSQSGPSKAPRPNWDVPTYLSDYPLPKINNYQAQVPFVSGPCPERGKGSGLRFTFSINDRGAIPATATMPAATGALSTSSVVYDASANRLAATLWNRVTIANGTYCGSWNGYLDTGTSAILSPADHSYQIRLLHDNVQYTWDGMVGVSEPSISGPDNWDSAGSFPTGISFLLHTNPGQKETDWGVVANGYNEGTIQASIFQASGGRDGSGDPDTLWPLNLALVFGGEFDFTATDGEIVYFGARSSDPAYSNAVVGFTLTSSLPPMSVHPDVAIVSITNEGAEAISSAPLVTYGKPPWGTPYIFSAIDQPIPVLPGHPKYFTNNSAGGLSVANAEEPHSMRESIRPAGFVNGVAVGPARIGGTHVKDPAGMDEVRYSYGQSITGLAVQRSTSRRGNLLAVAHGRIQASCYDQQTTGNSISLWDKRTGVTLGNIDLAKNNLTNKPINPQKMAFDLDGNLWVVDGGEIAVDCSYPQHPLFGSQNRTGRDAIWKTYGSLIKVTFSSGDASAVPKVVSILPISTVGRDHNVALSNPVDVAVSPVTGHVFVADGGVNQQVFEFDATSQNVYSRTGQAGGYGQSLSSSSSTCNASVGTDVLWLDYFVPITGSARPWIAIDSEDRLWIGDYSTSRILHFTKRLGAYEYSGSSQKNRFIYSVSVPHNDPSRVFTGPTGMLEYRVDYPTPDPASGRSPPMENIAFSAAPARNWFPCFLQAQWQNGGYPDFHAQLRSAEEFSGGTFGLVYFFNTANPIISRSRALVALPPNGVIRVKNFPPQDSSEVFSIQFDANGNYYGAGMSRGQCENAAGSGSVCETFDQYSPSSLDEKGFPAWDKRVLATATLTLAMGDPQGGSPEYDFAPTTNKIIPLYSSNGWNWHAPSRCQPTDASCSPTTAPTYHLGGVAVGGNATQWHAQMEASIEYPTLINDANGTSSIPSGSTQVNNLGLYSTWLTYAGPQNMGLGAHGIDNFIFTAVNGNWQQFSCQLYQYTDDGMLVGQFGWWSTGYYRRGFGAPSALRYETLAPGRCSNPTQFTVVKVGGDYYLYITDEGYRAGVQRWHIWNTTSIGLLTATTVTNLSKQTTPLILH